jgi:putative tryptophan/tyrosine transport system substrate-binding protein
MGIWSSIFQSRGPRPAPPRPTGQTNRFLRFYFIIALGALLLYGCPPRTDRRHIVVLSSTLAFQAIFEGFKAQMEELGYREGVNVSYDFHNIHPPSMTSEALASLADRNADLILAFPTEAAIAAKKAVLPDSGIPVVFAYAGIEDSNLVASVRAPGDHITGVRFPGPEQIGKRLEILHTIAPHVKRVWIGYDKDYPNTKPALAVLRPLAELLEMSLVEVPLETVAGLAADLRRREAAGDPGLDAMLLMPDTLNHSPEGWQLINSFARSHNLPVAGSFLYTVAQGAVFGNANDLPDIGKSAASLAAKIFDGIPAGTIPVITPEQDLYINTKRARELELYLPEGLLRQAKVILR